MIWSGTSEPASFQALSTGTPIQLRVAVGQEDVGGWGWSSTHHPVEVTDPQIPIQVSGLLQPVIEPVGEWSGQPELQWWFPEGTTEATIQLVATEWSNQHWFLTIDPECASRASYPALLEAIPEGTTVSLRVRAEVGDVIVVTSRDVHLPASS